MSRATVVHSQALLSGRPPRRHHRRASRYRVHHALHGPYAAKELRVGYRPQVPSTACEEGHQAKQE